MKRRMSLFCVFVLLALMSTNLAGSQSQRPPRLVIDNRYPATASVEVWSFNGSYWQWTRFTSVGRNSWLPVMNVQQGQRFRALLPDNRERTHDVTFSYDRNYGGGQSIWVIQ